jgi:hypothetical protein
MDSIPAALFKTPTPALQELTRRIARIPVDRNAQYAAETIRNTTFAWWKGLPRSSFHKFASSREALHRISQQQGPYVMITQDALVDLLNELEDRRSLKDLPRENTRIVLGVGGTDLAGLG